MNSPLVSVILPVYNGATFLRETIESVLTQTYKYFELIVVDDGSTDDSKEIIQSYPEAQYVYQTNQGVPFARNAGVQNSNGQYLCFIDQDDLWLPEKLEKQIQAFRAQPELGYCITRQVFYLSPDVPRPAWCPEDWLDKPLAGYSPSTFMITRSLFEQKGAFDTGLLTGSDTEFFFKLKDEMVAFLQLDEVLVKKRVHSLNQSTAREALRRDIMETVRRSIHRQRNIHKAH